MDAAHVLRRAAGVEARVGQGCSFACFGRFVCTDCPDDRHLPAFRPFALPTHMRTHLQAHPGHSIRWWCWDHLRYGCVEAPVKGKRTWGGKRPGTGGKPGNANALKHGRHSSRQDLTDLLALLPSDARLQLLPYLRDIAPRMNSIKCRLALVRGRRRPPRNVLPFLPGPPSTTTTTHAERSSEDIALGHLALRAAAWGFIGAQAFVRVHSPAALIFEGVLDDLDHQADSGATLPRNPGGLIRESFHLEAADHDGPVSRCPYCRWTTDARKEATS